MDITRTAFASDYDGTLCQSNWETGEEYFDPAVLEAIERYRQAGGLFGVCTGRPMHPMSGRIHDIVDLDFYIVTTGAAVFDRNQNVLFERTINHAVARELYEQYASDKVGCLAITDVGFFNVGKTYVPKIDTIDTIDQAEGKLLGVSLEFSGDEQAAREARNAMNRRYAGVVEGFQNLGSVDVVAYGCSKGTGVEVVRKALGVSVVAGAGDSYNDLPLLTAADVSYTFHTSPAQVRAAATHTVEDLAEALGHFMQSMGQ